MIPDHGATKQPIKVLFITPIAERGGAEVLLLNILRHCNRDRFEPFVCALKSGPFSEEVRMLGIPLISIETRSLRNLLSTLRALRSIRHSIRRHGIDLVFSNMAMGHIYGGLAALGTRVKRVWFQHTISSGGFVDRLAAAVPADRVYVNSRAGLEALLRLRPAVGRSELVYPGTNAQPLPTANTRSLLRRSLGIPQLAPVAAMVGRFQRGKGQHLFVEAAIKVKRQRPDAFFLLIGDTRLGLDAGYRAEVEACVRQCGLGASVLFTGWRDDVQDLLGAVDLLVHPATGPESFGLVVIEAMVQGMPVIVSDQGGLTEIVQNGENGFVVPPGNTDALAERMLLLFSDQELSQRLGSCGRGLVVKRFSLDRMIGELEASLGSLMPAASNSGGHP